MAPRKPTNSTASNSTGSNSTAMPESVSDEPAVSSRRLRRREIDRRSQRLARERTKNRIAELEALVNGLREEDSSGRVASLMNQVEHLTQERTTILKTMASIHQTTQQHANLFDNSITAQPAASSDSSDFEQTRPVVTSTFGSGSSFTATALEIPHLGTAGQDLTTALQQHPTSANRPLSSHPAGNLPLSTAFDVPSQLDHYSISAAPTQPQALAIIPNTYPADTSLPLSVESQQHNQYSLWHFANATLTEHVEMNDSISLWEDAMTDDTPVRALVEGWDVVEKRAGGKLPPSWSQVRRIDETMFSSCTPVVRLAMLRVMNFSFRHFHDTRADQLPPLPPWMAKRPCQTLPHSFAINYLAWPGLRERFIFEEQKYAVNDFWALLCSSLEVSWPFEFRDCYMRNINTGQYCISTAFDARVQDINAWRMGPDMFQRFPELYSDIAARETVTASCLLTGVNQGPYPQASQTDTGPKITEILDDIPGLSGMLEDQPFNEEASGGSTFYF